MKHKQAIKAGDIITLDSNVIQIKTHTNYKQAFDGASIWRGEVCLALAVDDVDHRVTVFLNGGVYDSWLKYFRKA
jgi:hypothetical protein